MPRVTDPVSSSPAESSSDEGADGTPEEVVIYACKRCPGKRFTAAERDVHRQMHRDGKITGKRTLPAPAASDAMFEEVDDSAPQTSPTSRRRKERKRSKTPVTQPNKPKKPKKQRKVRSIKTFDPEVSYKLNDGG